jgi:hypothetical protein
LWHALPLTEQAHVLHRLVERIDYQVVQQTASIAFRADSDAALWRRN